MGDISRAVGLLAVGFVVHRIGQKRGFKEGYKEGKKQSFSKEKPLPDSFFKSTTEATKALAFLEALIRDNGVATIADLYRFVGRQPSPDLATLGWTDVSTASVVFDVHGPNLRIPGTHKL